MVAICVDPPDIRLAFAQKCHMIYMFTVWLLSCSHQIRVWHAQGMLPTSIIIPARPVASHTARACHASLIWRHLSCHVALFCPMSGQFMTKC